MDPPTCLLQTTDGPAVITAVCGQVVESGGCIKMDDAAWRHCAEQLGLPVEATNPGEHSLQVARRGSEGGGYSFVS